MTNLERRHLYIPLMAGILTPSVVIFILQVFVAKISPFKSVLDILNRQFAEGHNLFLLMLISFIPFAANIFVTWLASKKMSAARLDCIFWGGFIPVLGFTLVSHFSVWYPLYAPGQHMSSTAVVAFVFLPIAGLEYLVIGSLIGWVISLLPKFRKIVA
jgi:hypothetical protein